MSRRISRIAGATAASALLLTGLSSQGALASTTMACAPGRVCGFNQGSMFLNFENPVNPGQCKRLDRAVDYLDNESNAAQRVWSGTNCTGRNVVISSGGDGPVNLFWSVGGL